jgi:hypothetical protein
MYNRIDLDPDLVRAMQLAKKLASALVVKDTHELNVSHARRVLKKQHFHCKLPFEIMLKHHFESIIVLFEKNKQARLLLQRLSHPLANPWVEKLIRISLGISEKNFISDYHLRLFLVEALLSLVRQTVGSCFATSVCIMIQIQLPMQMLEDLFDLMTTGHLKRVNEGVEYRFPICAKTGFGPLIHDVEPIALQDFIKRSIAKDFALDPKEINDISQIKSRSKFSVVLAKEKKREQKIELAKKLLFEEGQEIKQRVQHPLTKCWEYTVASFTDANVERASYNMYIALGLSPEDEGGLASALMSQSQEEAQDAQSKVAELEEEIEVLEESLRGQDARALGALGDSARSIGRQIQVSEHRLQTLIDERQEIVEHTNMSSGLPALILSELQLNFPYYFQELYDPEMHEFAGKVYEDSPAGFRLVYKHGTNDPLAWTHIYTKEQYLSCLEHYLNAMVPILIANCEWNKGKDLMQGLIDSLQELVQTEEFYKGALARLESYRQKITQASGSSKINPYSYISGASVESLCETYFRLNRPLVYKEAHPSSFSELLIWLIDLFKEAPQRLLNAFEKNREHSLIIRSSSHAFLLKGGYEDLKKAYHTNKNSYIYVRDEIIRPAEAFFAQKHRQIKGKSCTQIYEQFHAEKAIKPIIFADSNWSSDLLAFFYNPIKGELDLARMRGNKLYPLVEFQSDVDSKSSWRVFINPFQYGSEFIETFLLDLSKMA